jgi:hypothetical protein
MSPPRRRLHGSSTPRRETGAVHVRGFMSLDGAIDAPLGEMYGHAVVSSPA